MLTQTCGEIDLMKEKLIEDPVLQGLLHLFLSGLREGGGQVKLCVNLTKASLHVGVVVSAHLLASPWREDGPHLFSLF